MLQRLNLRIGELHILFTQPGIVALNLIGLVILSIGADDKPGHLLVDLGFPIFRFPDFEIFDFWKNSLEIIISKYRRK